MNMKASCACIICRGKTSPVLLSEYITKVQDIYNQNLILKQYFPDKIEVSMNRNIIHKGVSINCVEKMARLATLGDILLKDIVVADERCNINIHGNILSVEKEYWKNFNVTDAGMNYDQALQINDKKNITKIHEDTQLLDDCWIHTDEISLAVQIPQSEIRCMGCSKEFNSDRVNLMVNIVPGTEMIELKTIMQKGHDNSAIQMIRRIGMDFFIDNNKENLWLIMYKSIEFGCLKLFNFIYETFPQSIDWPDYDQVLHSCIQDSTKSKETLVLLFGLGNPKTKNTEIKNDFMKTMLKKHRDDPDLLIEKLEIIFENRVQLGLIWDVHMMYILENYFLVSIDFNQEQFINGINIIFKYAEEMVDIFSIECFFQKSMILDATRRGDIRLLIFLTEEHHLDIHYVNTTGENAFFRVSNPSVIQYLHMKRVNLFQMSRDGSTALTSLLDSILENPKHFSDADACNSVALYLSYGLHNRSLHNVIPKRNRRYNKLILKKYFSYDIFFEYPYLLVERIYERNKKFSNLHLMMSEMNL